MPSVERRSVILSCLTPFLFGCVTGSRAESNRMPWFGQIPQVSASTQTASFAGRPVRVRLLRTRSSVRIGATGPFEYRSLRGQKMFTSGKTLSARAGRGGVTLGPHSFQGDVVVTPQDAGRFVAVNGRRYRGTIHLRRAAPYVLEIIEEVGLEPYLYGVLPKEVGTQWPEEALKAQAVVSRTYVLANMAVDPAEPYDVSNDVSHQVYGGLESEDAAATRAVDATSGVILLGKESRPIQTFFHAACGGETDLPEAVWPSRVSNDDYASVKDPYCKEYPRHQWKVELSWSLIENRLRRAGIPARGLKKITLVRKTASGRAELFGLKTSRGTLEVGANRFRLALGPEALRSTRLTDIGNGRKTVRFEGLGWGHGVGLCQWGARGRALAGHPYHQILNAYFPSAVIVRLDERRR